MRKTKKLNVTEALKGLVNELGGIWLKAIEAGASSSFRGRAALGEAVKGAAYLLGSVKFGHWVDSDARLWGYLAVGGEEVYFLVNRLGAFIVDPSKVEEAATAAAFAVEVGA
ncbi:hypothetical protein MN1_910 [Thermus phage MN1]|nr:hypothetical protein MN1_910 [Thermus phage MN1]